MTGVVVLAVALVATAGFGVLRWRTDGNFSPSRLKLEPTRRGSTQVSADSAWSHVLAALPGERPGERATLVQFSSAFCAPCRTARVVLSDVASKEYGVRHVEVDAEQHLDLVRALDVRRTPTTLVLDADGHELVRAAGAPTRQQVLAALPVTSS
ncbi:thioredoxin family protein [Nocardioides panacisoli]|uniref:Thioredoxin family protein n=1 Tax=Nocardioides panacisoli TaxID=627624 RepID=A0ABP7IWL9_9ACTN